MSVVLNIQSEDLGKLIESIDSLGADITSADVKLVAGNALKAAVQQHLYKIAADSDHHRTAESLGAPRTGLYLRAADHTHDPQIEGEDVSVAIEDETGAIAQRYFGGEIHAEEGHLLTIPARTEAYGHRAREFRNLRLIMFPSGAGALVEAGTSAQLHGRRKPFSADEKSGGLLFFWLVKQVHQDPDPTVLPTEQEMLEPVLQNVSSYISRHWSAS